jgi:uncharacterized lipoprotein NlpE involved in copper resistance
MKELKITAIIAFIAIIFTMAGCDNGGDTTQLGDPDVYTVGYYTLDGVTKACYWINGIRNEIDGKRIDSITVANGIVYVAGEYKTDYSKDPSHLCRYWIDGIPYEIPDCGYVYSISVFNGDVYVVGETKFMFGGEVCYWKNGIRNSWPVKSHSGYLTVVNNDVHLAGQTYDKDIPNACYWVNGVRKELTNSETFIVIGIKEANGNIYIGGIGNKKACYWLNGVQFMISSPEKNITYTAFTVSNGNVYFVNDKNKYWINGIRKKLAPGIQKYRPGESGIITGERTIFGDKIYIAGHKWDSSNQIAFFWVDGKYNYLNGYDASSIFILEK